jgi:hypothetical protein
MSGDTIQIRGDGPFSGANPHGQDRLLSIVAAPGYLPTFNSGVIASGSDRLIVEGLRFVRGAGASTARANLESARFHGTDALLYDTPGYFVRVANTAIDDDFLAGWLQGADSKPAEIVNCFIDKASPTPFAGGAARLENCVFRLLRLRAPTPTDGSEAKIEVDRCVVWHPGPPPTDSVAGEAVWQLHTDLAAHRTWFYSGLPVSRIDSKNVWRGFQNVFSAAEFSAQPPLAQQHMGVEIQNDADSFVGLPPLADPANWRLLGGSAVAGEGAAGKDLGADVDQILAPGPPAADR